MKDVPSALAEEIFCDALEIASEEDRMVFIKQRCATDDSLLTMVMDLLSSYCGGEQLFNAISPTTVSVVELANQLHAESLNQPAVEGVLSDDGEVGKTIGLYQLLQKIGEGGGGSVYLAQQEKPVRRQVALKIIKLGLDTKSVIARFEAERQALAMMEHPNIARVINAGATDEGRPYFAMELVLGTRITTYCDQHELGIAPRLELFIQVCHAIQHAHQKGIIHRDIKPSNVIITELDGIAIPKVIDFGIAKATSGQLLPERTEFTAFEQFVGTPAYMSPEQADLAEMDIDVRSDIYSLGVLLYELLTGGTPFNQKELILSGVEQMRRTIRETEPLRPSVKLAGLPPEKMQQAAKDRGLQPQRLVALLADDLDWIVLKALDKDREQRYRSADGFADDIERYLKHEPVVARPPSRRYRLKKLVRRNKVVFGAGSAIVAILLLSSGVSTWLLIQQNIARRRAELAEMEKGTLQREKELLNSQFQKQQLTLASELYQHNKLDEADAALDDVSSSYARPENALMYRSLGDRHALAGHWGKARARFEVLDLINAHEDTESTMDDCRSATLLAEQGHLNDYEKFRESMISRYAGTQNPVVAQRVLRNCLLLPANDQLMLALEYYARVIEDSFAGVGTDENGDPRGWQAYSMAIMSCRKEDYEATLTWCKRAKPNERGMPTRAASVLLLRSIALHELGRIDEARSQYESCQPLIQQITSDNPPKSLGWMGYWFDQAYVRIHLHQADSVLNPESGRAE